MVFSAGKNQVANLLIEKGADVNIADRTGTTPLHLAAKYRTPELVDLLIKHGADVNQKDENNKTALDLAENEKSKLSKRVCNIVIENNLNVRPNSYRATGKSWCNQRICLILVRHFYDLKYHR